MLLSQHTIISYVQYITTCWCCMNRILNTDISYIQLSIIVCSMLQIRRTFELYDKHGLLGKDDIRKALKDLGHETKAEEALKWAKLNDKDGLLYDEYLKVIYWLDDKQRNEVKHKV